MNAQEYISSGAIEACLMGLANEAEWQELQQMVSLYPEVKAEKEKLELEMERQHLSLAVKPPPALRQKLLNSLAFETEDKEAPVIEMTQPSTETTHEIKPAARPSKVPVIPTPKPVKWLQRAVAVSVVLLMGSILLNFYFYSKSASYQKQYNELVVQQNSLMAKNRAMEASFKMMKDPGMKQVVMKGTAAQPASMATVYWSDDSKDVYLLVNHLPQPAADKQYQLWAIVEGKPVDAGMVQEGSDSLLIKMNRIPNAQAFAITLEKKGGSPTPDLTALYVMGEI